jgi:phosphate-selective porin OprO/OprP
MRRTLCAGSLLTSFLATTPATALAAPALDATASSSPAPTVNAAADATSPWLPPGESEHMAKQPLDAEGAHFKPGTGLVLKSRDGRFGLATRPRVQLRYTFENDHEAHETGHSFQIRRARLQFKGNAFGKHNKYKVEFAFSPKDLGMKEGNPTKTPVLTWYAEFDYLRDLTFKVGQYKIPYSRQRVVSSGDLEMVDRALGNNEFNLDRDIGLEFLSKDIGGLDIFRYHAGVFMGEGRDAFETQTDFGLHYLARVEVLPMGGASKKWDYSEADLDRLAKPRLSLGVAYSFIDNAKKDRGINGSTPSDGGTTDYQNLTADFVFKVAAFSLSGEFYWREGKRNLGDAVVMDEMGNETEAPKTPTRDGVGYFVQAGYLIPRLPLGVAARWSQVIGLGSGNENSLTDGEEVGGAFSYYIAQHPLKLQIDYFRKRRDAYDVETFTFARQSWANSADEVRVQMQFAF